MAVALKTQGIDCVKISGGSYEHPKMMGSPVQNDREGYFIDFATAMKASLTVPLVLTGGFRSGTAMEAVLAAGNADIIGLARPLAMEPDFPNRLLADIGHTISLPRVSTGIRSLDAVTSLGLTWYEYHLYTMGKGKDVNPQASAWLSVFLTFWRMGGPRVCPATGKEIIFIPLKYHLKILILLVHPGMI